MQYNFPLELWEIIKQKANNTQSLQRSISQKQQEKIKQDYLENIQEASESETIKALSDDINLFGIDLVFPGSKEK